MGLLSGIARVCLVIINVLFLIIGLALAVAGFILRFGKTLWEPVLKTGIDLLKKVGDETGLLNNLNTDEIDLGSIILGLAIGLIVGGLVLCVISLLGCCGACYKINIVLWLYVIVIAVFFVGEAVAIGILYGKPELAKDELKKNSVSKYKGLQSEEVLSLGWNIIMLKFKCCGVDNYEDFNSSTDWDRTLGRKLSGSSAVITPIVCCKDLPSGSSTTDFACAQSPFTETKSNGKTGCYDKIWGLTFGKTSIAVPVLVICGLIQIGFIIFAVLIIKCGNEKVSPV